MFLKCRISFIHREKFQDNGKIKPKNFNQMLFLFYLDFLDFYFYFTIHNPFKVNAEILFK